MCKNKLLKDVPYKDRKYFPYTGHISNVDFFLLFKT